MTAPVAVTTSVSVTVSSGVAISAKSTSTTAGDHVGVFNLAADGGANNAGRNVVSANSAFSACEGSVTGTEFGRAQFGSPSSGSGRGGGSPRLERFFSEDAERAAGGEMALDVEDPMESG